MINPEQTERWNAILMKCRDAFLEVFNHPVLREYAVGVRELDLEIQRVGGEMLEEIFPAGVGGAADGPDVYLATELPEVGGHTLLIGDFVQTFRDKECGSAPWLIATDLYLRNSAALKERVGPNLGFDRDRVEILTDDTPAQQVERLLRRLLEIRPKRLFLFHHPDDVVCVAAAQTGIAAACFMVHHADLVPTLGLYAKGVRLIELHPTGAAMSRALQLDHEMLLLTAPDPGERSGGFYQNGFLTTASSGRSEKFEREYAFSYPETVGLILRTSAGKHIHIGPLSDGMLDEIRNVLLSLSIDEDKFMHIPRVPSLAAALLDYHCDVYVASFPCGGGRASAEVAASGIPFVAHLPDEPVVLDPLRPAGAMLWRTWDDLAVIIGESSSEDFLQNKSRVIREFYNSTFHPDVFKKTLQNIVAGKGGVTDPDAESRDEARAKMMAKMMMELAIRQVSVVGKMQCRSIKHRKKYGKTAVEVRALRKQCDRLSHELEELKATVKTARRLGNPV